MNYTPVLHALILSVTCADVTVDLSGESADLSGESAGGSNGPLKVKPTHQGRLPAFQAAS